MRSGMTTIQDSFQLSNKAVKTLQQENLKLNEEKEVDQEKIRNLEENLSKLELDLYCCGQTGSDLPIGSMGYRSG